MNYSEAGKLGWLASAKWRNERKAKFRTDYESNPKLCKFCSNPITFEKRENQFCSNAHAASFNNKGVVRNGKPKEKFIICKNCDMNIKNGQYCNSKCQQAQIANIYIEKWKLGGELGCNKKGILSNFIRNYLFSLRGRKCEICSWAEVNPTTNKVPVQIDHKDGNAYNCHIDNLQILCPNHHSLTPTYGGLNRGKGRLFRYR